MLTTLALIAALTPAVGRADDLKLTNVRFTQYLFGPERTDTKYLPGDILYIAFDIEGLKIANDGKVEYEMGMAVTNAAGKKEYAAVPTPKQVYNLQGSSTVTGSVHIELPVDQAPGKYNVTVTVIEPTSKAKTEFTKGFEVLPKDYGLVRKALSMDQMGYMSVGSLVEAGQMPNVFFAVVGFGRNATTKQPNLSVNMQVVDAGGKPMTAKPYTFDVNGGGVGPDIVALPITLPLHLNKPGKCKVEVTVTDKITNKTAQFSLPVNVVDTKDMR
jgi:hypothetical protein